MKRGKKLTKIMAIAMAVVLLTKGTLPVFAESKGDKLMTVASASELIVDSGETEETDQDLKGANTDISFENGNTGEELESIIASDLGNDNAYHEGDAAFEDFGVRDGVTKASSSELSTKRISGLTNEKSDKNAVGFNSEPIYGSESIGDVTVHVMAPVGTFPEGTEVFISPIASDDLEELILGMDVSAAVAFDITFITSDGGRIQPRNGKEVIVTFSFGENSELSVEEGKEGEIQIYHIGADGKEKLGRVEAPTVNDSIDLEVKADKFSPYLAVLTAPARNTGEAKLVDIKILNFKLENLSHKETDKLFHSDTFYIKMEWDASANGINLHEGDYFDVTLPDNMRFPKESTARDFNLLDTDGNVVAKAHVTPGEGDIGGSIHVVFTSAVENKYNVKGTMYLGAKFNIKLADTDKKHTFKITVNGEVSEHSSEATVEIEVTGPKELVDEYLVKWGQDNIQNGEKVKGTARWIARINHMKADMTNAVITDSLSGGNGAEKYIRDSFTLRRIEMDAMGNVVDWGEPINISDKLTIAEDDRSFTLNLGDLSGKQYRLEYVTTYLGGRLRNNMELKADEKSKETSTSYQSAESGGTAGGDIANRIRIKKVNADNPDELLKGAIFKVTAEDGSSFELGPTGNDGTVTSDVLRQGTYKVVEASPPTGYDLNSEEFILNVTEEGASLTVEDKRILTGFNVTKVWKDNENQDGSRPESITIRLLADRNEIESVQLGDRNNWSYAFEALPKFDTEDGREIEYTVSEDAIENYRSSIIGTVSDGFTIINTRDAKCSISVEKKWIGPERESATVILMNGDSELRKVQLSRENHWRYVFDELDRYNDSGEEITYSIKEVPVEGYSAEISGDSENGFIITNTNQETISVDVTKRWIGPEKDEAVVILRADGTDIETLSLNAENKWRASFEKLPKYDKNDGHEIVYDISEKQLKGYSTAISGTAKDGYTVINTITDRISIPVRKIWTRGEGNKVTVRLYADGIEIANKELSADNKWQYIFENLEKYKDGKEISYTLTEDSISGYRTEISYSEEKGFIVTNTRSSSGGGGGGGGGNSYRPYVPPTPSEENGPGVIISDTPEEPAIEPSGETYFVTEIGDVAGATRGMPGASQRGNVRGMARTVDSGDDSNTALYLMISVGSSLLLIACAFLHRKRRIKE